MFVAYLEQGALIQNCSKWDCDVKPNVSTTINPTYAFHVTVRKIKYAESPRHLSMHTPVCVGVQYSVLQLGQHQPRFRLHHIAFFLFKPSINALDGIIRKHNVRHAHVYPIPHANNSERLHCLSLAPTGAFIYF
jgi:hypothetical protein